MLYIWTVYKGARDIARPYSARLWGCKPGGVKDLGVILQADSLEDIRDKIQREKLTNHIQLVRLEPNKTDPPHIVESWI